MRRRSVAFWKSRALLAGSIVPLAGLDSARRTTSPPVMEDFTWTCAGATQIFPPTWCSPTPLLDLENLFLFVLGRLLQPIHVTVGHLLDLIESASFLILGDFLVLE